MSNICTQTDFWPIPAHLRKSWQFKVYCWTHTEMDVWRLKSLQKKKKRRVNMTDFKCTRVDLGMKLFPTVKRSRNGSMAPIGCKNTQKVSVAWNTRDLGVTNFACRSNMFNLRPGGFVTYNLIWICTTVWPSLTRLDCTGNLKIA